MPPITFMYLDKIHNVIGFAMFALDVVTEFYYVLTQNYSFFIGSIYRKCTIIVQMINKPKRMKIYISYSISFLL